MKKTEIEKGEKIVKSFIHKQTLNMFKIGCDKSNYRILNTLPTTTLELTKELKLTKMPLNKRLNELEKVGLLKRYRKLAKLESTELGIDFLKLIAEMEKDVLKIMPELL